MSGTCNEGYVPCPNPNCYQVYTSDGFPGWQADNGTFTLFLYGWDDRQLFYSKAGFPTMESPGSTCCQASTGNRYDSPLIDGCDGMVTPECICGCTAPGGVE